MPSKTAKKTSPRRSGTTATGSATRSETGSTSRSATGSATSSKRPTSPRTRKGKKADQKAEPPRILGRCGGRPIINELERELCDRLTGLGVTHSHRPRHFEIRLENEALAAFAPTMVMRGRGREGKTVVIETVERLDDPRIVKIRAFRKMYGLEFYFCLAAPEEVLDGLPLDTYDEAAATTDLSTLVSRLAD